MEVERTDMQEENDKDGTRLGREKAHEETLFLGKGTGLAPARHQCYKTVKEESTSPSRSIVLQTCGQKLGVSAGVVAKL